MVAAVGAVRMTRRKRKRRRRRRRRHTCPDSPAHQGGVCHGQWSFWWQVTARSPGYMVSPGLKTAGLFYRHCQHAMPTVKSSLWCLCAGKMIATATIWDDSVLPAECVCVCVCVCVCMCVWGVCLFLCVWVCVSVSVCLTSAEAALHTSWSKALFSDGLALAGLLEQVLLEGLEDRHTQSKSGTEERARQPWLSLPEDFPWVWDGQVHGQASTLSPVTCLSGCPLPYMHCPKA